jgi:AraC-like DNA-binding protein
MYTLSGRAVGDVRGREFAIEPDTVCLFPPDRDHGYQADADTDCWRYRWIEFSGAMARDVLAMFRLAGRYRIRDCQPARPHVEALVTALASQGNAALHEATALLMRILAAVEQAARLSRVSSGDAALLDEAAKTFMFRNLPEDISLESVAEHVGVSRHHLIRVFKARNGTSPMQYLRQLRVNRAKRLLHDHRLNISEVGQAVGYDVLPHFSRMFKRSTGLSPRQFRRLCARASTEETTGR